MKKTIVLRDMAAFDRASMIISTIPTEPLYEVVFREHKSTRSVAQNARMWAMLTDISRCVVWHGRRMTPEEWKHFFSASLNGQTAVPNMDSTGFIVLAISTSKMTIAEMCDMTELMYAFGAEHNVTWSDPSLPQDEYA